jgi:hypothetical protein
LGTSVWAIELSSAALRPLAWLFPGLNKITYTIRRYLRATFYRRTYHTAHTDTPLRHCRAIHSCNSVHLVYRDRLTISFFHRQISINHHPPTTNEYNNSVSLSQAVAIGEPAEGLPPFFFSFSYKNVLACLCHDDTRPSLWSAAGPIRSHRDPRAVSARDRDRRSSLGAPAMLLPESWAPWHRQMEFLVRDPGCQRRSVMPSAHGWMLPVL